MEERIGKMPRFTKQKFRVSQVPLKMAPDDTEFLLTLSCFCLLVSPGLQTYLSGFTCHQELPVCRIPSPPGSAALEHAYSIDFCLCVCVFSLPWCCLVTEGREEKKFGRSVF